MGLFKAIRGIGKRRRRRPRASPVAGSPPSAPNTTWHYQRVCDLLDQGWNVRLVHVPSGETVVLKCRQPFQGNRCPHSDDDK